MHDINSVAATEKTTLPIIEIVIFSARCKRVGGERCPGYRLERVDGDQQQQEGIDGRTR